MSDIIYTVSYESYNIDYMIHIIGTKYDLDN